MIVGAKAPDIIRTLNFWGADMKSPSSNGGNWTGDCPLCGKPNHFFCDADKTLWDCKVCGASGNHISFLNAIFKSNLTNATDKQWDELAAHRKIPAKALKAAGLGYDGYHWLFPCVSAKGTIHDIRRYDMATKVMMSTAGCKTQLWGAHRLSRAAEGTRIWVCEGEWDAIAMTWLLDEMEIEDDVVVAVPGAGVFKDNWTELFANKQVITCYDADNAGEQGTDKCIKHLSGVARTLKHIAWPITRPSGYDIRDHVVEGMKSAGPQMTFKSLIGLMADEPRHHNPDAKEPAVDDGQEVDANGEKIEPATFDEVVATFKKHILLTPDLELALTIALATVMSNDIPGDPVWMYVVGPPGAGKTMILGALSSTKRAIFRSSVTPHCLVSGWRGEAGGGAKDPSLIPRLTGKTFVCKDFTEVLSMPVMAQEEVLSTLRGAYDGFVQKTFGNGITREYFDCHFSFLAGVTGAIHGNRQALLGERFLKLQIARLEGDDADSVIASAIASVGIEKKMEEETKKVVTRFLSKRLNAETMPDLPSEYAIRLTALVQLVAMLRAQVEREKFRDDVIVYRPTPENGTRLAKQLMKLGVCLAYVLSKRSVDAEVYSIMERVAMDTAHGFNLDVIDEIMRKGGTAERSEIVAALKINASTVYRRFDDLLLLGAIVPEKTATKVGRPATQYAVNKRIQELWLRAKSGEQSWRKSPSADSKKPSAPSKRKLVLRRRAESPE